MFPQPLSPDSLPDNCRALLYAWRLRSLVKGELRF